MSKDTQREGWGSRIGVIMAVAGSAVGIGNFLRFPGNVAEFGGGAFMIAYFISFILLGLPMCWAEWTMGRYAGQRGFNAMPGILATVIQRPFAKYLGVFYLVIPLVIYMYFVCVQAWCLGYAVNFALGTIDFVTPAEAGAFFGQFVGIDLDGSAFGFSLTSLTPYLLLVLVLDFFIIYRGLSGGIELFCKFAIPTLVVIGLIVLVRVLTLGAPVPEHPEASIANGLGYMWNPTKVYLEQRMPVSEGEQDWHRERELVDPGLIATAEQAAANNPNVRVARVTVWQQLLKPNLWLAAASQIFFSLSVGFGIIATYASYLRRKNDVALSALSAASANEFTEVAIGGLITIPPGVAFLGVAGIAGSMSLFGLGFHVLPLVFSSMPAGALFGFFFFFLLFLGAMTAGLSTLQPGIAFLEEALQVGRRLSVALLGLIQILGCFFVFYFSHGLKALDTLDFWAGTFMVFVAAMCYTIIFSRVIGGDKLLREASVGASIAIPRIFKPIITYVSPAILITVFVMWVLLNVLGLGTGEIDPHITDLVGDAAKGKPANIVAQMCVGLIILLFVFFSLIVCNVKRYKHCCAAKEEVPS